MPYKKLGIRGILINSLNEFSILHPEIKDPNVLWNMWGIKITRDDNYNLSDPDLFLFLYQIAKKIVQQPQQYRMLNRDIENHMSAIHNNSENDF